MKNLPFENAKHRLLWKLFLHTIEVIIFPIIPIFTVCKVFNLFERETVSKFKLIFIIIAITLIVYLINFFIGKLRTLPETSDARRRLKYTMVGVIDTVPWLGVVALIFICYNAAKNIESTMTGLFSLLLIIFLVLSVCKIAVVWLNALLIKYLDVVDEDAERGYLLSKAFKYKDGIK